MEGVNSRTLAGALAVSFLMAAALTAYGFASRSWLPPLASSHGAGIDAVIAYLLVVTGVIFIAGHLVLALFVLKYSKDVDHGPTQVSRAAEWRWAVAPVVLMCIVAEGGVLWVGMPAFKEIYGEAPDDALEIEVVGKQFEWITRYSGADGTFGRTDAALVHDVRNPIGLDEKDPAALDDVVKRGSLHLPVDRPVAIRLRSLDVLHSFTVPAFRTKQDLIPGFSGRTQFTPVRTGTFELACAELCGLGHYRMRSVVTVESPDDFEQWLGEQEAWFQ